MRRKKEEPFAVLDIGTEAVKTLIVKKDSKGINILGSSVKYFDYDNIFDKGFAAEDFELEITKEAVLKSLEEAFSSYAVFSGGKNNIYDFPVLLTINPKILHALVVEEVSVRDKKEKKISRQEQEVIYRYALKGARDRICEEFFRKSGIIEKDIDFVFMKIIGKKIEGYPVENIEKYHGRNLSFKVLGIFLSKLYGQKIYAMLSELGLKVARTIHPVQAITDVFPNIKEGAFLDMGGQVSQVFLINNGILDKIETVDRGGSDFTERIFDSLNVGREEARNLKERYASGSLSSDVSSRIKDMMAAEKNILRKNMVKCYKSSVFLFGGGSCLSEARDIFSKRKIISTGNFKKVEDLTKKTKSPQFVPAVLVSLTQ